MKNRLSHHRMIEAVLSRDANYDGQFFFGVTSTKIFCVPSCKAKKPLVENLRFFKTKQEATAAGFRGCKRCFSEDFPNFNPKWFKELISVLNGLVSKRVTETELSEIAGVDISTIRRHFNLKLNISPLSYHRKIRLLYARDRIEKGGDIKQFFWV
ncbi:MAG: Ada metal-binding domain-containing protein [Candidatus Hodarchaeales archaeon]